MSNHLLEQVSEIFLLKPKLEFQSKYGKLWVWGLTTEKLVMNTEKLDVTTEKHITFFSDFLWKSFTENKKKRTQHLKKELNTEKHLKILQRNVRSFMFDHGICAHLIRISLIDSIDLP